MDLITAAKMAASVKEVQMEVAEATAPAFLTPDALMAYCESRLRGIDTQIKESFARQEKVRSATGALGKLQEQLAWSGRAPQDGIGAGADFDAAKDLYGKALAAMPEGAEKQRLQEEFNRFIKSTEGEDMFISSSEAADLAKNIGSIAKDLSSSAELDMIGLQSFMSQRQQALQMCTNMISGLGQSSQQIAANIGK